MNISPFTIYVWGVADDIKSLCAGVAIAGVIVLGIGSIIAAIAHFHDEIDDDNKPFVKKLLTRSGLLIALCAAISALTPSSKTIALMVVLPRIAQSDAIQKDAPEVYRMAVDALKAKLQPVEK